MPNLASTSQGRRWSGLDAIEAVEAGVGLIGPDEPRQYDSAFRATRFDVFGTKTVDATIMVLHNGVLIQDHAPVPKTTAAAMNGEGPEPGPLYLQDHGNPVRYRNVWMRRL